MAGEACDSCSVFDFRNFGYITGVAAEERSRNQAKCCEKQEVRRFMLKKIKLDCPVETDRCSHCAGSGLWFAAPAGCPVYHISRGHFPQIA